MKTFAFLALTAFFVFQGPQGIAVENGAGASSQAAQQLAGQIVWVKGEVKGIPAGDAASGRTLSRQSPVYVGETVVTSDSASGQIVFTDGSLVSLRSGTRFVLEAYHYDGKGESGKNRFGARLLEGGFRTVTGLISKTNREGYSVSTPVATIGVRGTAYSVYYSSRDGLAVKLDMGAIDVRNDAGEIQLSKDREKIYAQIKGLNSAPEVTDKQPEVFSRGEPAITPAAPPASPPPSGGSGGDGGGSSSSGGSSSGSSSSGSSSSSGDASSSGGGTTIAGTAQTDTGSTTVTTTPSASSSGGGPAVSAPRSSSASQCLIIQ